MKTGKVIKNAGAKVTQEQLSLINKYTRRQLTVDEVYVFSVVLCDNDIDRDYERFTVESLFELEKLFVGKTGIMDHSMKASTQTARIFSCKVEAVENKKTATGDDYFRLVAWAYIPVCDKTEDIIFSIDSGITKEVSVGCAVKSRLCSICSNEADSTLCNHLKGHKYNSQLCYFELTDPYDAYEFSFVAVPAQKNAGVIKAFSVNQEENVNMENLLKSLKKGEDMTVKSHQVKMLCEYISELQSKAKDAQMYRQELETKTKKFFCMTGCELSSDTLDSIISRLSTKQLKELTSSVHKHSGSTVPQLFVPEDAKALKDTVSNTEFTI